MPTASGPFEVKVAPISAYNTDADSKLGRMSLDKQFHGDLEATSRGEMLTVMGEVKGSGAYVAVERVTGSLQGRNGSFAMYHSGTMSGGAASLSVNIAPDSGTGELVGIRGKMNIINDGGKHSFELEYEL